MRHNNIEKLLIFFLISACFFPFLVLIPHCYSNSGSVLARYEVSGTVDGEVQGKSFIQDGNSYSKFSVPLQTDSGKVIVNCDSTQCASLSIGDKVTLSCYQQKHLFMPNETECRFEKLQ